LSQDRIDKLSVPGFTWVLQEKVDWNVRFVQVDHCAVHLQLSCLNSHFHFLCIFQNKLIEFKEEFGHCNAPYKYEDQQLWH
jgi:hypothetical protein